MLTSLVLTLTTDRVLTFPPHLGRASHVAFLRLISQADPDLAERLHAPDQRRPFTCSNLWRVRRQGRSLTLASDAPAFLRYTGLTAEVSRHLRRLAKDPPSHRAEIEFVATTAFRSSGRTLPLPLPALVYGGLVEKWNSFAPVAVSEEVRCSQQGPLLVGPDSVAH